MARCGWEKRKFNYELCDGGTDVMVPSSPALDVFLICRASLIGQFSAATGRKYLFTSALN